MRHRIYVDAVEPETVVTGEEFHHASRVVRLREGEAVEVFDRAGRSAAGIVAGIGRDSLTVRVERELPSREAPVPLHLAMAIINLEKFELVLQKATELGAASFVPLVTDRVELRRERYAGKSERWNKVILEAVKQSGRSRVPPLSEPATFDEVVRRPGLKIVFDADTEPSQAGDEGEATLFVGPEGGWSERELSLAGELGCTFRRLGPRRLRAETAAIVAVATTELRSRERD
ncbi:MAG: RsmE family RNA methyltransferase [Thermoanaerobaculia bacterium]